MRLFNRCFLVLFISFLGITSCAERPGSPPTTGLKQYIGNGFLIKYPGNANLVLKGSDAWAERTLTISGPEVEINSGEATFSMPSFEVIVEFYDNSDELSAEEFAASKIKNSWRDAIEQDEPTGYWPVNEEEQVTGRPVVVHGEPAWQTSFFSGDHEFVRTFISNGKYAMSVGYRSYPKENIPIQPGWDTVYLLMMETVRLELE